MNASNVTALYMPNNPNVEYLPIGLHEVFPLLNVLEATACAIGKVSKANFIGLKQLSFVWLRQNLIETIESETFSDLDLLIEVDLRKESEFSQKLLIY